VRGREYTAVLIGPGGDNFLTLARSAAGSEKRKRYLTGLNRYLADAYAELLAGELSNPDLMSAAEIAGLYTDGRPETPVITSETVRRYADTMNQITRAATAYYEQKLPDLQRLLAGTTPGRQGVSPDSMMMHLWRYIRKIMAR